jgi:hypothetical protein
VSLFAVSLHTVIELTNQPIAFDELISKAIAYGINDTGWKIALKKFLDFEVRSESESHRVLAPGHVTLFTWSASDYQAITFYTEDPTGPRRARH